MSEQQQQQQGGGGGYAIELYMDPALENQVLKAWNVVARRQISRELIEMGSRPHITLFSTPYLLEPSRMIEPLLRSLSSNHHPFPLSFSSLGAFPSNAADNILFLSPTPSLSLLHFQSQLCDAIRTEGIDVPDDYSLGNWIPFCSVAHNVPKARMAEALSLLRDLKLPVSGYVVEIALVQFSPVREICSFVLGNTVDP